MTNYASYPWETDRQSSRSNEDIKPLRRSSSLHNVRTRLSDTPKDANWQFYQGRLRARPDDATIDEMHSWYHDMDKLERNHGYIQWLFPISESGGLNSYSQPLQPAEAEAIRKDKRAQQRLLKSYEMMLNFYGMKIVDDETGELARASNWKERFENLNLFTHNHRRITRILKSLGELGLERHQYGFVHLLLKEAVLEGKLRSTQYSCKRYWIGAVKNKVKRAKLVQQYHDYETEAELQADIQRIAALESLGDSLTRKEDLFIGRNRVADQQYQFNNSVEQRLMLGTSRNGGSHSLPATSKLSTEKYSDQASFTLPLSGTPTSTTKPAAAISRPATSTTALTQATAVPRSATPSTTTSPATSISRPATPTTSTKLASPISRPSTPTTTTTPTTAISCLATSTTTTLQTTSIVHTTTSTTLTSQTTSTSPITSTTWLNEQTNYLGTDSPKDSSSAKQIQYKREIQILANELMNIALNISHLASGPSIETALETVEHLEEFHRQTNKVGDIWSQLILFSSKLNVHFTGTYSRSVKHVSRNSPTAGYLSPETTFTTTLDRMSRSTEDRIGMLLEHRCADVPQDNMKTKHVDKASELPVGQECLNHDRSCSAMAQEDVLARARRSSFSTGDSSPHLTEAQLRYQPDKERSRASLAETRQHRVARVEDTSESSVRPADDIRRRAFSIDRPADPRPAIASTSSAETRQHRVAKVEDTPESSVRPADDVCRRAYSIDRPADPRPTIASTSSSSKRSASIYLASNPTRRHVATVSTSPKITAPLCNRPLPIPKTSRRS